MGSFGGSRFARHGAVRSPVMACAKGCSGCSSLAWWSPSRHFVSSVPFATTSLEGPSRHTGKIRFVPRQAPYGVLLRASTVEHRIASAILRRHKTTIERCRSLLFSTHIVERQLGTDVFRRTARQPACRASRKACWVVGFHGRPAPPTLTTHLNSFALRITFTVPSTAGPTSSSTVSASK